MKFKVGDKVKVAKNNFNKYQYLGKVGTIKKVEKDDANQVHCIVCIDDEYLWFLDDELELAEKNESINEYCEDFSNSLDEALSKPKSFRQIATEIGQFTDMKNEAYGSSVDATYEVMKVFLKKYKNDDNTYTIPESLLKHILLQVRMIDKQNRVFNSPDGDKLNESPYRDLAGYSLIGIRMMENE